MPRVPEGGGGSEKAGRRTPNEVGLENAEGGGILRDRLEELWNWAKRKCCRHPKPPAYEEIRLQDGDARSWTAMYSCPDCGEVMGVEGSYSGIPSQIREALEEEGEGIVKGYGAVGNEENVLWPCCREWTPGDSPVLPPIHPSAYAPHADNLTVHVEPQESTVMDDSEETA